MVLSFTLLSLVGLLLPWLLRCCRILKATFDLSIWWSVQQLDPLMAGTLWMSILSRHLVVMKSIICQCPERGCTQVVLRSTFDLLEHDLRYNQFELRAQSQWRLAIGVAFPDPLFAHDEWPLVIVSSLFSHWSLLSAVADRRLQGCHWVHLPAGCRKPLVIIWVCHCWSVHADNCSKVVLAQR